MDGDGKSQISTSRDQGPQEVDLEPRFECPICLQCLKEPVLTSCGHRFCDTCIRPWLINKDHCPVDNNPLTSADLFPDHFTRREILGQVQFCPECRKQVSLPEYDAHMAEHNIMCPFKDIGCTEVIKKQLNVHLREHIGQHLLLVSKKVQNNHKAQESMLWQANKHQHQESEGEDLVRGLYERIVIAEQRILELQSQVQVARQFTESEINRIENCHGEFLWRVHNVKELLTPIKPHVEGGTAERAVRFSPAFSTSPLGYKFCARINLAPCLAQVSFVLHLLRSDHDDTLDWPIAARIKMSLVHPINSSSSITETVMSQPRLQAFQRPTTDMSPKAFGFPEFITVRELYDMGFVRGDVITFRIVVNCV